MKLIASVLSAVLVILILSATASAGDVDGSWSGTISGPMGDIPVSFTFKADGAKLTGKTLGIDGMDVAIQEGKIDGANISFIVNLDFGGMPFMLSYKGVVEAEQIKMTAEVFGMPFEFVVKKEKAK